TWNSLRRPSAFGCSLRLAIRLNGRSAVPEESLLSAAPIARVSPNIQLQETDHFLARQEVPVTPRAAWCAAPYDPSQSVNFQEEVLVANNPRAPATCADSLRLSFPTAPETSPHRAMAWDRVAASARSGGASKLLQSPADMLRAAQRSAFSANPPLRL